MHPTVEEIVLSPVPGSLAPEPTAAPLPDAAWYHADDVGAALSYAVPPGALAGAAYLSFDLLVDGDSLVVFELALRERGGRSFSVRCKTLNQCQARLRLPLAALDLNRWKYPREGACLSFYCWGERVDPAQVEEISLSVMRKGEAPARFCLTPLRLTAGEPPPLDAPLLPRGPLLDELGQSALRHWPGKCASAEEATARLRERHAAASSWRWPAPFSRWGGWRERTFEATGFFRTQHDGRRWWLVDPDGCAFWSAGPNCVRAEVLAHYGGLEAALAWLPPRDGPFAAAHARVEDHGPALNSLAANLIRAFGPEEWRERWAALALGELRRVGFNTVANWSDWRVARAAGFPYVRPLELRPGRAAQIYRDFPDVFAPAFATDAAEFAGQLRETAGDPALIGYFLMNEPTWGFTEESLAAGALSTAPPCATREALAEQLRARYGDDAGLAAAWGMAITLENVASRPWRGPLSEAARADLEAFSTVMARRLFDTLTAACRAVDPHHLNLGARYYTIPPDWAVAGMGSFDVFSVNAYAEHVNAAAFRRVSALVGRPILAGEWHFGALDAGLPASGIGRVASQEDRGRAYRIYLEHAASLECCVGAHWFTLYDQSALGRFDGENYNIGFLDVCGRPYAPLADAARAAHERIYAVAAGELPPYADAPAYLSRLF